MRNKKSLSFPNGSESVVGPFVEALRAAVDNELGQREDPIGVVLHLVVVVFEALVHSVEH